MTDWLLALVPTWGVWLMALATFFSCLALPVPCSVLMLTAGGFAAAGDLDLGALLMGSLAGAVAGDQTGYRLGRLGGQPLLARLARNPTRAALLDRAARLMETRGAPGIFFTRWLFAPVGPYANFTAGALGWSWTRFTLWGVLGEAVWVGLYCGLGYGFAGNIQAATDYAGSLLGILAGLAAMGAAAWWLVNSLRQERAKG
ncbi:DedA family protein [Stagnihabitans tardus]|uniref:DedA family protein n=1 Tax=Stagnihabitans tardus TaxID=2699202 RepID=A0AAE4YDB0_9RHOB|nr:DedA family protein [Stagnihabitans tardus]NBZ87465.1 DedA family protein [Stagnihabitans tardus]